MAFFSIRPHCGRTRGELNPSSEPRRLPGEPTHDETARLAYAYWEARGRHHGFALEDWLRAERELRDRDE